MGNFDSSQFQSYIIGQLIASIVGILLLVFGDFSGYYYRSSGVDVRAWVCFLGCGFGGTIIILIGLLGLILALYSAYLNLQAPEDATAMFYKENARRAMLGGGFTAALALIGAIIFILSSLDTDWWLDDGFYGAFFGGIITALFAKLMFDKIEI